MTSGTAILKKISAPVLPSTILHRKALLQALGDVLCSPGIDSSSLSPYNLVLLCSPAGYGKTTLLADTVKHMSITCFWYFLDTLDTDRVTFLETLLFSIRYHFPQFGNHIDPLLAQLAESNDNACYYHLITILVESLAADIPKQYVLALCNYHEVNNNESINYFVNYLLNHLPTQCILVIESRALPHIELAQLIAYRKIFGIGISELYFTKQELYDLAQVQGIPPLSNEEAEQLTYSFDGWIAGILLSSRLGYEQRLRSTSPVGNNRGTLAIPTEHQHLFSFVANEVFRNESKTYIFLKEVSVLEQLTAARCDFLLNTSDAIKHLEYAERQGLFVMRSGASQKHTYICHPVLRELLVEDLHNHGIERYYELQRRAAVLLLNEHSYEQALKHALDSQDTALVRQVVLEATPKLLKQGLTEVVRCLLAMLPEQIVDTCPQLLLLHVNMHLMDGEYANVQPLLDKTKALLVQSKQIEERLEDTVIQAEVALAQATLLLYKGDHQYALDLCYQALNLLPADEWLLLIRAHQRLGICLILGVGQTREGIMHLQQALHLCGPRADERQTAVLHHQLANAYDWIGNYAISEHHRRRALTIWEHAGKPRDVINNWTGMGHLRARQGFTEEAEIYFSRALTLSRECPDFRSGKAYALLGLGEMHLNQRHLDQALMRLEEGLALARLLEDRYLMNCLLNALALAYLSAEDIYTALYLIDQTSLRDDEIKSYEGISYHLARGTILLAQYRYEEAQKMLEQTARSAQTAGVQRLELLALLRLTICFLNQNQQMQATNVFHQAVELNKKGDHDYFMHLELHNNPLLQQFMDSQIEQIKDSSASRTPDITSLIKPLVAHIAVGEQHLPRLHVYALGEPIVELDNNPITRWRMARAAELFFFLIEIGRPVRKEQIVVALWPDASDQIDQTFRSTIYYLRKAIGETCVVQHAGLYSLDLKVLYGQYIWYDVELFKALQRDGKVAVDEQDDERASQVFKKMLALYRGDYVQSFYSNWCVSLRDELRQAYMDAHHHLALIAWRQEQWSESLSHWQQMLAIDTCVEVAHYGIIRCYIRQGKRELALRQYQRCSQELREQLMAVPGPSLQKLYQRILNMT